MADVVARLDDWGRPAWIGLMVLSFILFWPVGLAVLAFLIGSGRMGCGSRWNEEQKSRWERKMAGFQERMGCWGRGQSRARQGFAPTGNRAFDEYRTDMLKRLEEEAEEFRAYLERLRHAKDKSEFDQFMAERRNRPAPDAGSGGPIGQPG